MKGLAPLSTGALVAALFATVVAVPAEAKEKKFHFDMVRGAKLVASGCFAERRRSRKHQAGWTRRSDGRLRRRSAA